MKKIEVVEMPVELSASDHTENIYGVQKRQWRKWNQQSRYIFNRVYNQFGDQHCVTHPKMEAIPDYQWDTIRWNAAWLAADAGWESVNG